MKAATIRMQRIKQYPKILHCVICNEPKQREQYYYRANGVINSYKCISCCAILTAKQRAKPKIVLPPYNQKHSAINEIENLNHNPKFFSWLCAGTNQLFS